MTDENTAMDWSTLSQTKLGEVEQPPLKPVGHYVALFSGKAELGSSAKKGTLFAKFPIQVTEALADVDQEELTASGGLPIKGDVTFWFSEKSLWMFTDFAKGMGISDDLGITDSIEELPNLGEPFVVEAKHEPNDRNPDRPWLRFENPVPMSVWNARESQG